MDLSKMFYMEEKDWHELQAWAGLAYEEDKNEISGLMTAVPNKEGKFKISDVEILKQSNSGTSTELDAEAVAEYKMRYAMKHKNKQMKYVWWHSHHTMAAFWSGTDEREINAWKNNSFSLALVINLKEEYKFRVSVWNANGLPLENHLDIPLEIVRAAKPEITSKMKTLYKELCEDDSIVNNVVNNYNNYYQSNLLSSSNVVDFPNHRRILKQIESLCEGFMDGTIKYKSFKKELKILNNECIKNKYNFNVQIPNISEKEALTEIATTFPEDFIEYDNFQIKNSYQRDNDWYGGYV